MVEDDEIHRNKRTDKTYVSKRIPVKTPLDPEQIRFLRIVSKVVEGDGYAYAKEKGEMVLRQTPKRRKEIVAKFYEDDRAINVLTIQSFDGITGNAHHTHFSFSPVEAAKVLDCLRLIAAYQFEGPEKVNITDEELTRVVLSARQAAALVKDNQEVFAEAARLSITKEDVVALGYRKRQLERFETLLEDEAAFEQAKLEHSKPGNEPVWQAFFESNPWIFGYGLSYLYVSGFDEGKLERAVRGHDLLHSGKVADGLMRSRGLISALCFVEIKAHTTMLLDAKYRAGCWPVSRELAGAVAQVQATMAAALESLGKRFRPPDAEGAPLPFEVFNFRPKAFIVIGHQKEFMTPNGVHEEKYRSFEQFRNSLQGIEVLTFDELYERSRFIVNNSS